MISNVKVTSPFLFAGELLGTVVGSDPPDLFAVRIPPNKTVMERYSNNARVAEESGVHTVNRTRLLLRTTPTATLRREDQDERRQRGQARSRPCCRDVARGTSRKSPALLRTRVRSPFQSAALDSFRATCGACDGR